MADKSGFDLGGIVNNIKSMVNPAGGSPDADPNDVLGVQLADLSQLVKEVKSRHDAYSKSMSKDLAKINELFNGAYTSLQAIRGETADAGSDADGSSTADAADAGESSTDTAEGDNNESA